MLKPGDAVVWTAPGFGPEAGGSTPVGTGAVYLRDSRRAWAKEQSILEVRRNDIPNDRYWPSSHCRQMTEAEEATWRLGAGPAEEED